MPIQLLWQPNSKPKVADIVDLGLQMGGDDSSLSATAPTPGRVRLIEVRDVGKTGGTAESTAERLIATFHGSFHFNPSAKQSERITFEIFVGKSSVQPHAQNVQGFDPECVFGVDALVLTFVNREFVIFFPFQVDSRSEGGFLEIQAVAEVVTGNGGTVVKVLGQSMVLNLGIRRTHAVDTTSNLPNGNALSYTGKLLGSIILFHEDYLLPGGIRNAAQSTPDSIVLDPARIPVPAKATGGPVAFSPYTAGSMNVILMIDLLDDVTPRDSFLTGNITGVTNAAPVRTDTVARFRRVIQTRLRAIFPDAGFAGANVFWSDETGAATLNTAFTGAFRQRSGNWDLRNSTAPLVTSFWNFYIASGTGLRAAGEGEQIESALTRAAVDSKQVFLQNTVPIGAGTKRLTQPMRVASGVFKDLLTDRSGVPRTYKNIGEYNDAVERVAGKMAILIAHEVGHSLGLMHHCKVENGANYSESSGSPVLSMMSSGVESGGFGVGMMFYAQAKVIWAAVFGVTPTFTDTFLQNKVWTTAQVFTMDWGTRTTNFIKSHGEGSMARPGLGVFNKVPPFAVAPPGGQKGTFKPPSP